MALRNGVSLNPMGQVVLDLLTALKNGVHPVQPTWTLAWFDRMLGHACRHMELLVVPRVSVEAQAAADTWHLSPPGGLGPLSNYGWDDQTGPVRRGGMGDIGRQVFHWEHVLPVSDMKSRLMAIQNPNLQDVVSVLALADIAWILKTENSLLNKHGYRSKRHANPWYAYAAAGITMLP